MDFLSEWLSLVEHGTHSALRSRSAGEILGPGVQIPPPTLPRGIRKLFLGVFSTNERAIALYGALGFEGEGRLRGQVILDGLSADLLLMSHWI